MAANATQDAAVLGRALDALRGVMPVDEAHRLVMLVGLLRHLAESSRSGGGGWSDGSPLFPSVRQVWDELGSGLMTGFHLGEAVERGILSWEDERGGRRGLSLPDLRAVRPAQMRDVVGAVAQAPSPVRLFDLVLQAQSRDAKGGQYFTPRDVTRLVVEVLGPREGDSVYDPACGSGGMLVDAARYVAARGGGAEGVRLFGQDVSVSALDTAAMNLAVHDLGARLMGPASSLLRDCFPEDRFDVVAVNPPFNQSHWDDGFGRYAGLWPLGLPPQGNANFAWVQHCLSKLSPVGRAGILMPTGAATGTRGAERDIRARLVDEGYLAAVVELPAGLIPHVRNPVCLWILSGSRSAESARARGEVLLVDARETAVMVDKRRRTLPGEAVERISGTYASWRGGAGASRYADVPGWCRSVRFEELSLQEYDVLPSRHVPAPQADGGATADVHQRLEELTAELERHFDDSRRLERELRDLLDNR